jgi:hypothetical protein
MLAPLVMTMVVFASAAGIGCRQDMHDQPSYTSLESSSFFADGRASRQPITGTVARGQLFEDQLFHTGKVGEEFFASFPFPVTMEVMQRGRERYDIFCAPCHDRLGDGRGMVVRRGLRGPVSFHEQRLIEAVPGYYFDVITHGFGRMYGYAAQIPAEDRWAIAAYIRALQNSRQARIEEIPSDARERLQEGQESPVTSGPEEPSGHGGPDALEEERP